MPIEHQASAQQASGGPSAPVRVLRLLLSLPRVISMYPAGHTRVESHLRELHRALARLDAPLSFSLRDGRLRCDAASLDGHGEMAARFATELRRRRIRSLAFRPGVTADELRFLGRLLAADYRELFREGGTEAFLAQRAHPNVEILLHWRLRAATPRADDDVPQADGAPGELISPHVLDALREALESPGVMERLESILVSLQGSDGEEVSLVERLVWDFFTKPEWSALPPERVRQAVESFLDLLQDVAQDPARNGGRGTGLAEILARLDPCELLQASVQQSEGEVEDPIYELEPALALPPDVYLCTEDSDEKVGAAMERPDWRHTSLLVHCELLRCASSPIAYRRRRALLLDAIQRGRHGVDAVAHALRYVAFEMPDVAYEGHASVFAAMLESVKDRAILERFLLSLHDRPRDARQFLRRLSKRPNPFPLIARVLTADVPESFRRVLEDGLVAAAQAQQESLRVWARLNRQDFLHPRVLKVLLERAPHVLGAICKEILLEAAENPDRQRMIHVLSARTEKEGLRLLVLGLHYGNEECPSDILRAIGTFKDPLAEAVLREIVHRSNTATLRPPEAGVALRVLNRMGSDDARAFVWEVATKRCGPLYAFRRALRALAVEALAGGAEP